MATDVAALCLYEDEGRGGVGDVGFSNDSGLREPVGSETGNGNTGWKRRRSRTFRKGTSGGKLVSEPSMGFLD